MSTYVKYILLHKIDSRKQNGSPSRYFSLFGILYKERRIYVCKTEFVTLYVVHCNDGVKLPHRFPGREIRQDMVLLRKSLEYFCKVR